MSKTKRILVVEDEPSLLKAITISMQKKGIDTFAATSAKEAISQLESQKTVDAIWLDHYLLDNRTGLDLLKEVKNNEKWSNIPVFVVTNSVADDKVKSYHLLGIDNYYIKAESSLREIVGDIHSILKA